MTYNNGERTVTFKFYGDVADHYGITVAKVAAIVRKHELTKRRIYGLMAVDARAMRETMQRLGYVDMNTISSGAPVTKVSP